jgi:hypothetical protein
MIQHQGWQKFFGLFFLEAWQSNFCLLEGQTFSQLILPALSLYNIIYTVLWYVVRPAAGPAFPTVPSTALEVLVVNSALIAGFPLFKDISPAVLEKIAAISKEFSLAEGQTVFREGEKADHLHFLIKGGLALRVNIMSKPESVTVSFISKAYECFGWSGLVAPHYYTASAFCEEDCQVLDIDGKGLMQILSDHPEAGFLVMHRMAELISYRLRNSRVALLKTM